MKAMILLVISALVVSVVATGQKVTSRVQRFSGEPYVDPPDIRSGRISKWVERRQMMMNKLKRYRRMAEDVNFARNGMHEHAAPLKRFKRPVA